MTIRKLFRPSKPLFQVTTLIVLLAFTAFSVHLPRLASAAEAQKTAAAEECPWMPKFQDFLAYDASTEFLATIGETPASILNLIAALDASQREELWTKIAPMHPVAFATEMLVANGYERATAETLVAQLTPEELDSMIRYDALEGGHHWGGASFALGLIVVVAVVALIVVLIVLLLDHRDEQRASATGDIASLQLAATSAIGDHLRAVRAELGIPRIEVPTF